MITASADIDHFRYVVIGDSPYDLPGAGFHDIITGFDGAEDIMASHLPQVCCNVGARRGERIASPFTTA
jgi:hypothetical protein